MKIKNPIISWCGMGKPFIWVFDLYFKDKDFMTTLILILGTITLFDAIF